MHSIWVWVNKWHIHPYIPTLPHQTYYYYYYICCNIFLLAKTEWRTTGPKCVASCGPRVDGHYQSCRGCEYFAKCAGRKLTQVKCATRNYVFDANSRSCQPTSNTCKLIVGRWHTEWGRTITWSFRFPAWHWKQTRPQSGRWVSWQNEIFIFFGFSSWCFSHTVANTWRMGLRMQFATNSQWSQSDRQTFVGVRKHSRSFMGCCKY